MKNLKLGEIEKDYDLGLKEIKEKIKKEKAKIVLLQFPDGLKNYSNLIVDYLKKETNTEILVWLGSCFGACDFPVGLDKIKPKIDLIIQFGHNSLMPNYC
jgi:2-(3-amino-3-carboxypropyl)histidine synthase